MVCGEEGREARGRDARGAGDGDLGERREGIDDSKVRVCVMRCSSSVVRDGER